MKKIFLFPALFMLSAGIFISCEKEYSCEGCRNGNNPPQVTETNIDVYVAGCEWEGDLTSGAKAVAKYWKNGQAVSLTNGTNNARGTAIAVVGSNVYVAGDEDYGGNGRVLKYWKNGVAVPLTDGSKRGAFAMSIAVSGSDVYVAGMENDGDAYYIYATDDRGNVIDSSLNYHSVAKYWKNGQEIRLTNGENNANANSIVIDGNDVYVAGSESVGSLSFGFAPFVAKYWKNGQEVSLTNGTTIAHAESIAIVGSDVYVAGSEMERDIFDIFRLAKHVAKYWKNGQEILLTDGENNAGAHSIAVVGSDVYVAGNEWNNFQCFAIYWKNSVAVPLSNLYSVAYSITIAGNDVYVAGEDDIVGSPQKCRGTYWKNGVVVPLTNGAKNSSALSIVVVQR